MFTSTNNHTFTFKSNRRTKLHLKQLKHKIEISCHTISQLKKLGRKIGRSPVGSSIFKLFAFKLPAFLTIGLFADKFLVFCSNRSFTYSGVSATTTSDTYVTGDNRERDFYSNTWFFDFSGVFTTAWNKSLTGINGDGDRSTSESELKSGAESYIIWDSIILV